MAVDAMSTFSGLKKEVETIVSLKVNKVINKMNLVKRDEFEVLKKLVQKLANENEKLNKKRTSKKKVSKVSRKKVKSKSKINVKRILEIEKNVKHDVIAFLTSITERAGKEARYLHKGMTSSDVLDTCFNLQLKQSGKILLKDASLESIK